MNRQATRRFLKRHKGFVDWCIIYLFGWPIVLAGLYVVICFARRKMQVVAHSIGIACIFTTDGVRPGLTARGVLASECGADVMGHNQPETVYFIEQLQDGGKQHF
jgi:hypothetical protein